MKNPASFFAERQKYYNTLLEFRTPTKTFTLEEARKTIQFIFDANESLIPNDCPQELKEKIIKQTDEIRELLGEIVDCNLGAKKQISLTILKKQQKMIEESINSYKESSSKDPKDFESIGKLITQSAKTVELLVQLENEHNNKKMELLDLTTNIMTKSIASMGF